MTWTMMAIREVGDDGDSTLYPAPGEQADSVLLEPRDGSASVFPAVVGLRLSTKEEGASKWTPVLELERLKATLTVTDARVAVACSKYDKGGGWWGTSLLVVPLNAGSMALAAMRRRGKMLVGQVRYPWLQHVGASQKSGWLSEERLQLLCRERFSGTRFSLTVTLDKRSSAVDVAAEIARRAAAFRLATEEGAAAEARADWTRLTTPPPLEPAKGEYAFYSFAPTWKVQPATAFGPPQPASPQPERA